MLTSNIIAVINIDGLIYCYQLQILLKYDGLKVFENHEEFIDIYLNKSIFKSFDFFKNRFKVEEVYKSEYFFL